MLLRLEKAPGRSPLHDVKDSRAPARPALRETWLLARAELFGFQRGSAPKEVGGARRDRTDDLLLAKQALSQLSYGPVGREARSMPDNGGPG